MKKIIICLLSILMLTGCFYDDDFSDKHTYTTIYPIEYITDSLYNKYSTVSSIYPNDTDLETYELTNKQNKKYASGDKFIYGLSNEIQTAANFLNLNKNIQIIDAMRGMNYTYSPEELWMDPSNYLMMALNIKKGLLEYENNIYTKEEIENLYTDLKVNISELDVEYTLMGKNANSNYILASDNLFKYLEKYDINVLSLDPDNNDSSKAYSEAGKLINSGKIKYLYKIKGAILNEKIQQYANDRNLEVIDIDIAINLTEAQRSANENYITIMTNNLESYKKELFK